MDPTDRRIGTAVREYVDTLIVGAGPIGLACGISAARRGIDVLIVDAGAIAHSIMRYPVGMTFFTTPERLEIGGHPLVTSGAKATREEALKYYRGVARAEGLTIHPYVRLRSATRDGPTITCELAGRLGVESIRCSRLVLATGYFDHANMLGVPGESLSHVSHWLDEPHATSGLDIVIVGGKNSAVESALQCYRAGARVTIVYRRGEWRDSVKYWLRPDLENRIRDGDITAIMNATVVSIDPGSVRVRDGSGVERDVAADRVYALTGYHPDFALMESIGIEIDGESGRPSLDPETLETNVTGVHLAGSAGAGRHTSEVFIENGRYDGEKIFGGAAGRMEAVRRSADRPRTLGE